MARLGKSSLAARIANRRRDLALAVFSSVTALSACSKPSTAPCAAILGRVRCWSSGATKVAADPSRLEPALIELLSGPCGHGGEGRPVLLVIDDLERVLVADDEGGHRLDDATAPVLAAVLRAFDPR